MKGISMQLAFHYLPMCVDISVTHLTYTNDLCIFARADESAIDLIADCVKAFGSSSNSKLRSNLKKFNLYIAGVEERMKTRLLQLIGFQQNLFPFRYLNIPLATKKLRVCNYRTLTNAIIRKLALWLKQTLSYVRKLQLVKTSLQGKEYFWLSILPIPSAVIDKLYAICCSFIWTSNHPSISWTTIWLAKEEGGYEVRYLRA